METYIVQIIASVITLFITAAVRIISSKLIRKYGKISLKIESRTSQIIRVLFIIINSACIITLIIIWGVNPKNVFVALSSIFAVIGVALFAQWSILSNISAGIILFFTAPFKVGDIIRIMDKDFPMEAKIENMYTFYTHLRTEDGELHVYPNSLFLQKGISVVKTREELL
jgi:small-conductance mechanosensitive channel